MADAVCFIGWESYLRGPDGRGFFVQEPLSFNSRQARLHQVQPGDCLWMVSRHPHDKQYYIVAVLRVAELRRNEPRSLAYETGKPIKHGASIGQSIQAIRFLDRADMILLNYCLNRVLTGLEPQPGISGLWTKCDRTFANYFLANWESRRVPQAFLLFDSPPALPVGAPVFIHSEQSLRLMARFRESQVVSSYKKTNDGDERQEERERCWAEYRAGTIDAPSRQEFDEFWEKQDSIRALIILDNFLPLPRPTQFKEYGKALEWGYPTSVGWRPLDLFQVHYLMNLSQLDAAIMSFYLGAVLK